MVHHRRPIRDPYRPNRDPSDLHQAIVGPTGLHVAIGLMLAMMIAVAVLRWFFYRDCWAFERIFSEEWTGVRGGNSFRSRPLVWYGVIFIADLVVLFGWANASEDTLWKSWSAQHLWVVLTAIMLVVQASVVISLLWS